MWKTGQFVICGRKLHPCLGRGSANWSLCPKNFSQKSRKTSRERACHPRYEFLAAIESQNAEWWKKWDALFKTHPEAPRQEWLRERKHLLREELVTRLQSLGLSKGAAEEARRQIEARPTRLKSATPATRSSGAMRPAECAATSSLRDAVLAAIAQLSDRELREVWLPAGLVYDALKH